MKQLFPKFPYGVNAVRMAIAIALIGLVFMLYVAVNTGLRYGLAWNFDLAHNDHIGTFIASIAGTLFGLTNALLLYGTLKAQQRANVQQATQHGELVQDRNYDRLAAKLEDVERDFREFQWKEQGAVQGTTYTYTGLQAWRMLFIRWAITDLKATVDDRLLLGSRIDPANFYPQQGQALDLLLRLDNVLQNSKRLLTDNMDKAYMINKVERIQKQLSNFRPDLIASRDALWNVVNGNGFDIHPKASYTSDLLHVINELNVMIKALPEYPYRVLSHHTEHVIRYGPGDGSKRLRASEIVSVQIDRVVFGTKDQRWRQRLNLARLKVSIDAMDAQGRSLSTILQPFGIGILIDMRMEQGPDLDTKGRWRLEGQYNPMAQVDQYDHWLVEIGYEEMEIAEGEYLELTVFTNAMEYQGTSHPSGAST